jgi:hypothetical protein
MVFQATPIILAIWRGKMYRIRGLGEGSSRRRGGFGEVSERLIELVSKTSVLFIEYRGFESRPLRCLQFQSDALVFIFVGEQSECVLD